MKYSCFIYISCNSVAASLRGATGKHDGRNELTSRQINSLSLNLSSFSLSKVKSNGRFATGSSCGLWSWEKNGWARACSTVKRLRGCICSKLRRRSNAGRGVPGNWRESGGDGASGSFRKNRLALSDVTKSRCSSGSFPSFWLIIVN